MSLVDAALVFIALLLEIPILLMIWNWSVQRKMVQAVICATILILIPIATSMILQINIPVPVYLAFGATYVLSGLVWRWWKDDIAPNRWKANEAALAMLATFLFSVSTAAAVHGS